jgi:hypothetical protein
VGHFRQLIGNDIDGIGTTRSGEFANKVQLYPLPWAVWCQDQLELTKFPLAPVLRSAACVIPMYIAFDPIGQVAMPVATRDNFEGARHAQVPSDWRIMVQAQDFAPEVVRLRNPDPSILSAKPIMPFQPLGFVLPFPCDQLCFCQDF